MYASVSPLKLQKKRCENALPDSGIYAYEKNRNRVRLMRGCVPYSHEALVSPQKLFVS
jgi:hypothetical protein